MSAAAPTTDEAFARFSDRLESTGLRAALAYLLGLTDYRFIAIFRYHEGMANAAVFYDRENPNVVAVDEVSDRATYCCYVRNSRGVFMTADALHDPRLEDHVSRAVVQSYCGVPVMTSDGEVLGTLCHYDQVPRDPEQVDMGLMLQVASRLAQNNLVPPYPQKAG